MTTTNAHYSLAFEAYASFLRSCTWSVLSMVVLLLIYSLFSFGVIQNFFYFMQNTDSWGPWLAEVKRNWRLIVFAAVMFFIVGSLQFILVALPIASSISNGLAADSNRSLRFYMTSGALIACLPWVMIVLLVILFQWSPWQALASLPFSISPILLTGLLSGAILKRRLDRLSSGSSIENSIK